MTNNNAVYEGGAQRSEVVPMYRRVEWDSLRRVAEALTEGAEKYPDHEDGVENWKHGQKEFAKAAFDHVIEHLYKWKEGEGEEDHLGHSGRGYGERMLKKDHAALTEAKPPIGRGVSRK